MLKRLKILLLGGARDPNDPHVFHNISLIAFFAWVGLGADGLTSSCYGPEEAFITLQGHHYLGIFVALGTVITIVIVSMSYSQIIELFPTGGGGYLVASKLLSPSAGMVSGCALLIDYILTITLSIASGADAIFSFFPLSWLPYKLWLAVGGVMLLTILNMRGVKESVLPLVPIFLLFIITHAFAVFYAFMTHIPNVPEVVAATARDVQSTRAELGFAGMIFLILRSYSMGAGTYTGIEAVSNGLPILRDPKVATAKRTMRYMASSLAFMVVGVMLGYVLYRVEAVPGKTLNAVLLENITRSWQGGWGYYFVLITLASEAVLLFVAAQTGFLDGPRVLSNMALDRWFPTRFAMLSDRLVTQNGIIIMGGVSLVMMLLSRGSVRFLVVLYSINVFITFSLSQLGMVRHWWSSRTQEANWLKGLSINGIGLMMTTFILISVIILKFDEGGWITLLVTGSLIVMAISTKRHYANTARLLSRLDELVVPIVASSSATVKKDPKSVPACNPHAMTAVLFVSGFNGLGLHTLFSILRLFGNIYKNFVFVQIGAIDAGNFKGESEMDRLRVSTRHDVDMYVNYMRENGFCAEGVYSVSTDVVEEIVNLVPTILKRFPQSIFFGGQLVFPEDSFYSRLHHNYLVFTLQRKLYHQGIPFVILPIRV
ncbi:MAG: APC family permease [Proteobacteria bacterium]|nr:APC family permease [Pseudomonadota bacterium]